MNIIKFLKTLISSESIFHKDKKLSDVLDFQNNEVFESGSLDITGTITAASTTIYYVLPLNKNIPDNLYITVESLNGVFRGINGYVNNQNSDTDYCKSTDYTITATKVANNLISIKILKKSAFTNVTNNTPVVVSCKIKIRFKKK